jgi:hypothetical protein
MKPRTTALLVLAWAAIVVGLFLLDSIASRPVSHGYDEPCQGQSYDGCSP